MTSRRNSNYGKNSFSEVHKFKVTVAGKRTEGDGMEREDERKPDLSAANSENDRLISSRKDRIGFSTSLDYGGDDHKIGILNYGHCEKSSNPSTQFASRRVGDYNEIETQNTTNGSGYETKRIYLRSEGSSFDDVEEINSDTKKALVIPSVNENTKGNIDIKGKQTTLMEEINMLRKENRELESRLQIQIRVNDEIKKLLIAAVGEDVETRLHLLAEDKHNLAKQLVSTVKSLSTHQEQIDWLAGQCEVWRSKFLASSMLVEDLARINAELWSSIGECKNALKLVLQDNCKIRLEAFETFTNLKTALQERDYNAPPPSTSSFNMISLCTSNRHLSQLLLKNKNIDDKDNQIVSSTGCESVTSINSTPSEILAEEMLSRPTIISSKKTELAYNAVMSGAAIALSASAVSPCCSHCTGTVSTI